MTKFDFDKLTEEEKEELLQGLTLPEKATCEVCRKPYRKVWRNYVTSGLGGEIEVSVCDDCAGYHCLGHYSADLSKKSRTFDIFEIDFDKMKSEASFAFNIIDQSQDRNIDPKVRRAVFNAYIRGRADAGGGNY